MLQKQNFSQNVFLDNLNDCKTNLVTLDHKDLIFGFDESGLDILMQDGQLKYPYKKLRVIYRLSNIHSSSAMVINYSKFLRRNAVKMYSINEFIELINKKKFTVQFISQLYNSNECNINAELIKRNKSNAIITLVLKLHINEIVYEWF